MKRMIISLALGLSAVLAQTQEATPELGQRISLQFKDSDITQIAEAVSQVTGKTFIVDPRVRAQVTMLSSTPMSPDAFYQAFLSILQVHGFVAVPAGGVVKILPDANARQVPGNDLPEQISGSSDEFVTQVVPVKSVPAVQLVQILRPLMAQTGHMAAHPGSNLLILSDRAANVNRLIRIIRRIDQEGDATVEVVPLQNASAAEITRIITALYQQQATEGGSQSSFKLAADERSNSILVSGEQAQRLRIKTLIAHLDTPIENGGDTQVRYLRYADAEKIAVKLKEQLTGVTQAAAGGGAATQAGPAAQAEKGTIIWADQETNALIITAPPKTMKSMMTIIDKLDIRRAQVLVEAIIVEVSQDKSSELGVNWAAFSEDDDENPAGGFFSAIGGATLIDLVNARNGTDDDDDGGTAINPALGNGTTIGVGSPFGIGRIGFSNVNLAAMLRAIRGDSENNVIATPSAITMDNQEAELKVAQEVPFVTGQFTTNTGGSPNPGNPFQTIQREEVGTILKVTPQISADSGDAVMLKIELESSSIAQSSQGAVDLITNKRTVNTNVIIEDGGIVVLGGLISDSSTRGEQRVPFLGRIPLIGLAFKTRSGRANKTNLMVFIRPKILRDGVQTAIETNSKYNYMREEQRKIKKRELLPILPGVPQPKLPDPPPVPNSPTPTPAPPPATATPQAAPPPQQATPANPPPNTP
jgi:general secretion pathway protein D